MSHYDERKWLYAGILITLLFICYWISLAQWHAVHEPPTPPPTAKQLFADKCEGDNKYVGDGYISGGIPNVGSNNYKDWTCTWPQ